MLEPREEASVAAYQQQARAVIDDILSRGATPILVGGSGLYVSSVLYPFRFPGTDPAVRERLEASCSPKGPGILHRRLHAVDPVAAEAIGPRNGRRLVRALEVVTITGEPFGAGLPGEHELWRPTVTIGLRSDRARADRAARRARRRHVARRAGRRGRGAASGGARHHGGPRDRLRAGASPSSTAS